MSATMEIVVSAEDRASDVIEGIADTGEDASGRLSDNMNVIGAATAGAGVALEGYARSQQDNTEASRRLANSTGMVEGEVRELAGGLSNATFPLDEVFGLMEIGRQRGLKSAEQLEEYAGFWDTVGDATGLSSQALAEGGAALEAVGVAAGNEKEALAAFGYITQETTQDVGDLLSFVDRMGPDLRDLGLDVNDTAAIMGALENELGMTARTARQEFRTAVNEADGDLDKALGTLGLSQEQYEQYRGAVAESSDVIQDNADIHAEARTPLQRMQSSVEDLMMKYGGLAEAGALVSPVLMGLGGAMFGVNQAMAAYRAVAGAAIVQKWALAAAAGAKAAALGVATAATWALNAALAVLTSPITIVVVAIAALVAGLIYAYRNSETFRAVVDAAFAAVAEAGRWMWESVLKPAFGALRTGLDYVVAAARAYMAAWQAVFAAVAAAVQWAWGTIISPAFGALRSGLGHVLGAARSLRDAWGAVWGGITGVVRGAVNGMIGLLNRIPRGIEAVVNGAARAINRLPTFDIPDWVPGVGGGKFGLPTIPTVSLPRIPTLHSGGRFRTGTPGGEGLAMLRDREDVVEPGGLDSVLAELRELRQLLAEGQVLEVDEGVLARTTRRGSRQYAARNRRLGVV